MKRIINLALLLSYLLFMLSLSIANVQEIFGLAGELNLYTLLPIVLMGRIKLPKKLYLRWKIKK